MWRFTPIYKSGRKVKQPNKQRTTDKREAFIRQAERAVKMSFVDGVTKFKKRISQDKLAQMYEQRDYTAMDQHIGWDELEGHLGKTSQAIDDIFDKSFDHAIKTLRADEVNPEYVNTVQTKGVQRKLKARQKKYLVDLKDNREGIHQMIAEGHKLGRTPRQVALSIKSQIALSDTQRKAVANFQAGLEQKGLSPSAIARRVASKERRMLNERANLIAITETRVAAAAAETVVWQKQAKDGLLDPSTVRVWAAEPDACEEICKPMDGTTAPLDGKWTLPGGRQVTYPAESHPRCRCVVFLQDGD